MRHSVALMGIALGTARRRLGLSVHQLATKSRVHRGTIYRLESAQTPDPSHSTVQRLEQALGLEPGVLVFGQEALAASRSESTEPDPVVQRESAIEGSAK